MKRVPIAIILFVVTMVSCAAPGTVLPTQISAVPTFTLLPTMVDVSFIDDGGLISGKPCASPCFFGIRAGETPFDQGLSILRENGIESCIQDVKKLTVLCNNHNFIGADTSNALVNRIGYYPDRIITVEEIIRVYGAPDVLQVIPTGIPEAPTTVMLLLFDKLKMRVHLPEIEEDNYVISSSSKIELVNYFDDILYSDLKANIFSQPWAGYGTYYPNENH